MSYLIVTAPWLCYSGLLGLFLWYFYLHNVIHLIQYLKRSKQFYFNFAWITTISSKLKTYLFGCNNWISCSGNTAKCLCNLSHFYWTFALLNLPFCCQNQRSILNILMQKGVYFTIAVFLRRLFANYDNSCAPYQNSRSARSISYPYFNADVSSCFAAHKHAVRGL